MEIVCSAIAGICARVLCHPLDTIKTVTFTGFAGEHELTHAAAAAAASASASTPLGAAAVPAAGSSATVLPHAASPASIRSSARSIWLREGFAGFYRGVGVAAVGSAPGVALYLTTYDRCSAAWKAFGEAEVTHSGDASRAVESLRAVAAAAPMSVRFFMCGLAAETVSCLVWVPIDVAKERLQSQPPSLAARYTSSLDALQRIVVNEGVRGLYKGYWSTLGSFGPFSAVYFVFYESFGTRLKALCAARPPSGANADTAATTAGAELTPATRFLVALGAGAGGNVVASLCTNPLELVKTRLQVQRAILRKLATTPGAAAHPSLYAYQYEGLRDGLAQMAKTEGVRALWRGVGSRIAYTAPNAALTMGFFELLKSKLM